MLSLGERGIRFDAACELRARNIGMDEITLLGVRIDRVSVDEALAVIEDRIRNRQPAHVVTADASMVVLARQDADLLDIVNRAELVTPDGSGILWASRLLRKPVLKRVSGVDLVAHLCRLSADTDKRYRIYFLGAAPGVAQKAVENLCATYPGANIVGCRDGFFAAEEERAIAAEIAALQPDIVLVAFGIPKQEKFIKSYKEAMGASIYIGVGGSFDVYSGLVTRAPVWMQNAGLEWIYRLCQNPKKISKVMTLPRFVLLTIRARLIGSS
jgi:N-acetylglucosaminyldiphosphoundecaprenol N-acetyl-beta-D-mannosaminyltransferase